MTQGYWKNHGTGACHSGNNGDEWPAEIRNNGATIGNVEYTADELCSILNETVGGNCLISVSHQYIAAKLNIANGSDPSCIQETIDAVDALVGDLVVPPVGNGTLPCNISGYIEALTAYNEGRSECAAHCGQQLDPQPFVNDNPCRR